MGRSSKEVYGSKGSRNLLDMDTSGAKPGPRPAGNDRSAAAAAIFPQVSKQSEVIDV
ncbi:hypothetical protein [Burkholderia gladioli]|uniref:hypothetical protein n=1 Tax=Burkholderia gladioli TaxID=28095 RepID=UPI00163EB744|nr:hypothetical protein [Burkholderia gladioli]